MPDSAMKQWLEALLLPWTEIPERWATATALAETFQGLLSAGEQARHEWTPVTCRTESLPAWGRALGLPRHAGESNAAWRRRLAEWRSEPVGTSGWARDEVQRITGTARVIEFPRDGARCGFDRCGFARAGRGPKLILGAADEHREAVDAMVDRGVPPDAAVRVHAPTTFDRI